MQHSPGFLKIVAEARSRVKELSVNDVKAKLARTASFVLVDVREESEWAAGHLPKAVHIGKGVMERDIEKKVPDTAQEIILYCGGGYRSALSADTLQKMGYTNVWSMDGGFRDWKQSGGEVVS
jgi:rhodanese-related sulfurtransferase